MTTPIDLFARCLPAHQHHPNFAALLGSDYHASARAMINEAFARMGDPNGHFVSQFQGYGFHARLFEIACFLYLETAGLAPGRPFDAPDFMVSKAGLDVAVEAMTANPTDGNEADISMLRMEDLSPAEVHERTTVGFPRKMRAALTKKARRGYHTLEYLAGKPLVLMTQPAFEAGSSLYVADALVPMLFGDGENGAGFFARPDAAAISAIAYCNGFAVSKFWRLSGASLFGKSVFAQRHGTCLLPEPGDYPQPREFAFDVGDPDAPEETWWQGVTLFLNPNATVPLPAEFLPATCVIASDSDGSLSMEIDGFHPLTSHMRAIVSGL